MQFKVVPFVAAINKEDSSAEAANQLEQLANELAHEGWEFMRLENVETHVAGDNGCMGIGATPGSTMSVSMAVFKK